MALCPCTGIKCACVWIAQLEGMRQLYNVSFYSVFTTMTLFLFLFLNDVIENGIEKWKRMFE
jgi:hypothetical protein